MRTGLMLLGGIIFLLSLPFDFELVGIPFALLGFLILIAGMILPGDRRYVHVGSRRVSSCGHVNDVNARYCQVCGKHIGGE